MKMSYLHGFTILFAFCLTHAVSAQTTWDGGGADDNWFTALNWDTDIIPNGITADVIVGVPAPMFVNGNVNINSLMVIADGVLNLDPSRSFDFGGAASTTLVNLGTITTGNNANFQLAGSVINMGNISIATTGNATDLEVLSNGATLDGGGTITLMGPSNLARIVGSGSPLLTIADQTIQGTGNIGNNLISLDLQSASTIDANVAGETLLIDPNGNGMIVSGKMQASNGGTLSLNTGTFDNTNGTIDAMDGSNVALAGTTVVSGGVIQSTGGGQVDASTGQNVFLSDLTLDADVQVANNSDFGISGVINNTGTVQVNSTGNATDIEIQSTGATLDGGGTTTLTGVANLARINGVGSPLLTIADQTIQGTGNIGSNLISIDLQSASTINANVDGETLLIDPNGNGMINSGAMQASNGGTLTLNTGAFDNTDGMIAALDGSNVALAGTTVVSGGIIQSAGSGQVDVQTGQNVFLSDLTLDAGVQIANNSDFGISGAINNTGSVQVNSTGSATDIEIQSTGATLNGGGTITLTGAANLARINGVGSPLLTIADQTIQGTGNVGNNLISIDLHAANTIDANVSGETLLIDPNGNGMINSGTMRASNGGTLTVNSGTFDNTDGMIEALDGSNVALAGTTVISGGTIQSTGSGQIEVLTGQNVFLSNLTLDADVQVANNTDFGISGIINNTGSVQVDSTGGGAADIEIQSTGATLGGGGTITLTGPNSLARIVGAGSPTLTIADQTIQGYGNVGNNTVNFDFQPGSTLHANVNGETLLVDPLGDPIFGVENVSELRATNGGILRVDANAIVGDPLGLEPGAIEVGAGSNIRANSIIVQPNSVVYGNNGFLRLELGSFTVQGIMSPGDSPADSIGYFEMIGDLSLGGETRIEISSASSHDRIFVRDDLEIPLAIGQLSVGGKLTVSLLDGFIPQNSDAFEVMDSLHLPRPVPPPNSFDNTTPDGRVVVENGTGSFSIFVDNGHQPLGGDSNGGSGVALSDYQELILGDVNGDGVVNLLDVAPFVTALSNGTYSMEADINIDGVVNLLDVNPFIDILSNN